MTTDNDKDAVPDSPADCAIEVYHAWRDASVSLARWVAEAMSTLPTTVERPADIKMMLDAMIQVRKLTQPDGLDLPTTEVSSVLARATARIRAGTPKAK